MKIGDTSRYKYSIGDPIQDRNVYDYVEFSGEAFLFDWHASRGTVLDWEAPQSDKVSGQLPLENCINEIEYPINGQDLIQFLTLSVATESKKDESRRIANRLVQTFEIRKRIYVTYTENLKPLRGSRFDDLHLYIAFGGLLLTRMQKQPSLVDLNALLKLNDTLVAFFIGGSEDFKFEVQKLVTGEYKCIDELVRKNGISFND